MRLAPILVVIGCGGTTPAPRPVEPAPSKAALVQQPAQPRTIRPDQVCHRLVALNEQHCAKLDSIGIADTCAQEFTAAMADPDQRPIAQLMGECTIELETCADVVACLAALDAPPQLRGCHDKNPQVLDAAVGVPREAWKRQLRRNSRRFSDVASSKARPVEVCGVPAENDWLASLMCDDGSRPLTDSHAAERARLGNVGDGGRCDAIIDRYKVQCPEASYEIYLDGYVCPLPQ